jgi:hypothetical protein
VDFSSYRHQLLDQPAGEVAFFARVRNFSRWFFDLSRNFVLVGGLKYFYGKLTCHSDNAGVSVAPIVPIAGMGASGTTLD